MPRQGAVILSEYMTDFILKFKVLHEKYNFIDRWDRFWMKYVHVIINLCMLFDMVYVSICIVICGINHFLK